ncbi:hypothetical protein JZ751_018522 [Albula glossodonta]|uniref:Transcription factor A, mitochondrial n=1 Tax=Albula glossodonta TaxID=121402 RepID=A0A8T2NRK8_9TELE|nr:hypothetical protein JZ751_018522 [Albula glossodonta]
MSNVCRIMSFISTRGGLLSRLLGVSTNALSARCSCSQVCLAPSVKGFSTLSSPPRIPPTGYIRFLQKQHPLLVKQYPSKYVKYAEITKKIAQQWKELTPEQKLPFQQEAQVAREQYKVEISRFYAQLSPAQAKELKERRKQKIDRRRALRKKREMTKLGKPKRPRSAFNIFMLEHFVEAKGISPQAKLKTLCDEWRNLDVSQRKMYQRLAVDDKARYNNEMNTWESYMTEIGREDLVRKKEITLKKKSEMKDVNNKAKVKTKVKTKVTAKSAGRQLAQMLQGTVRKARKPEE